MTRDTRSSELYSYWLAWSVQSSYSSLQHEIIYWEANRQTQIDNLQHSLAPPSYAHTRRVPGLMVSESGNRNRYNMMGLQNNTVYHVTVRSQNKFGWSPYSSIFTFQTMDKLKMSLTLQEKPELVLDTQGPLKSEPVVSHSPGRGIWLTIIIVSLSFLYVAELR